MQELADLLGARGFESFKEARHPFGLTQRQAAGKFTSAEVDEIIERVTAIDTVDPPTPPSVPSRPPSSAPTRRTPASRNTARHEESVLAIDSEVLATELVNRGWCCIPPPPD